MATSVSAVSLASIGLTNRLIITLLRSGVLSAEEVQELFAAAIEEQRAIGSVDNSQAAELLAQFAESIRLVSDLH